MCNIDFLCESGICIECNSIYCLIGRYKVLLFIIVLISVIMFSIFATGRSVITTYYSTDGYVIDNERNTRNGYNKVRNSDSDRSSRRRNVNKNVYLRDEDFL